MDFIRDTTNFIFISSEPVRSDIIFIPGGSTPSLPIRAAELYNQGIASLLLPSGRYSVRLGHFRGVTEDAELYGDNYETEWEFYRQVLINNGVPDAAILREDKSQFTYQNALFSAEVVKASGLTIKKAVLVCKAFHARRAYTYYKSAFPDVEISVVPVVTAGISAESWYKTERGRERVLGELKRLGEQLGDVAELEAERTLINENRIGDVL